MPETLRLALKLTNKHWKVYKQSFWSNIAPTFSDPIFFILSIGLGVGSYVSDLDGFAYVSYIAPGLAISTALWTAFFETSYNFYIRYNYEGVYKAILSTPLGVREVILGEILWLIFKGAGMSLGVSIILALFGYVQWQWIALVPLVGGITGMACGGLGFITTSFVKNINQFQSIYTLVVSPMFFFSGIFFPVDDLPSFLPLLAHLSPLYHGVAISQQLLWNQGFSLDLLYHSMVLIAFAAVLNFMAYKRIYRILYR